MRSRSSSRKHKRRHSSRKTHSSRKRSSSKSKSYRKSRKPGKGWSVTFKSSTKADKKMMAVFRSNDDITKTKTVHFGARGMSDYTIHKDKARRSRYDARHRRNENWNDPFTAGSLSKWILWGKPTRHESIKDFKKKFGFNS